MNQRASIVVGLLLFLSVSVLAVAQGGEESGVGGMKFTNVRYSPTRDGLVGVQVRLTRQRGQLSGRFTLYEGNNGRTYQLRGTIAEGEIRFTVEAGERTIEFEGHTEEGTLVGTLTTTYPNGRREQSEFKARRIYQ